MGKRTWKKTWTMRWMDKLAIWTLATTIMLMLLLLQHLKRCPNPRLVGRKLKTETEKDLHYYHYHYYLSLHQWNNQRRVNRLLVGYPLKSTVTLAFIFRSFSHLSQSVPTPLQIP